MQPMKRPALQVPYAVAVGSTVGNFVESLSKPAVTRGSIPSSSGKSTLPPPASLQLVTEILGELAAVSDVELDKYFTQMGADGVDAEAKRRGDFLVSRTGRDE